MDSHRLKKIKVITMCDDLLRPSFKNHIIVGQLRKYTYGTHKIYGIQGFFSLCIKIAL